MSSILIEKTKNQNKTKYNKTASKLKNENYLSYTSQANKSTQDSKTSFSNIESGT